MVIAGGSWVKTFNNKTIENGHDKLIKNHQASWSKGKLTNIKEVFISDGLCSANLDIPNTEWHQFDRYKADLSEEKSIRISRYLQALLKPEHNGFYLCYNNNNISFVWATLKQKPIGQLFYKVSSEDIGKWITFQISSMKSSSLYFSEKGSLNGEQLFK